MRPTSAALPIAFVVLRVLTVLNWLFGAAILALLLAMFNEPWIVRAFKIDPAADTATLLTGMRAIAVLGLAAIPLNHLVLTRLAAMVGTVRSGDPFLAANGARLQTIGWALLALQLLSLSIAAIAEAVSSPAQPLDLDAGFSVAGWLAVLLAFVLARVFAEGAEMRDDLEGTV